MIRGRAPADGPWLPLPVASGLHVHPGCGTG